MKYLLFSLLTIILTFSVFVEHSTGQKLSAEEIVSRHIASLGSKEDLAAASTRVAVGPASITSKVGAGFLLNGTAQLASTGRSVVFAMVFENPNYPYDKVAFDGKDVTYGLPNGKNTLLTNYLRAQSSIVKDGLLGGALSTAWPLMDTGAVPKMKIENAGTAKMDGRQAYKLKYSSSKTGELKVTLYFDAETFRHLRSEYLYTIEPRIGTSPTDVRSSSRIERYTLTEDFSDFKQFGKLTLPARYKITIVSEGQLAAGTNMREWEMSIETVYLDQKLASESFRVS